MLTEREADALTTAPLHHRSSVLDFFVNFIQVEVRASML